jgi:hypothetical protein
LSVPLLSEAGEMLMEEAHKQGINVEGKSRLEMAREIFQGEGNPVMNRKKATAINSLRLYEGAFKRKEAFK